MKDNKRLAIVGLGALGILYGNHLSQALGKNRVHMIVSDERKARYSSQGLWLNDKMCDFNFVLEEGEVDPVDVVIIATKSLALDSAMKSMQRFVGPQTTILSLINGISSEQILGERFGYEKVIPTVAIGMDATRTGNHVRSKEKGWLQIGEDTADKQARLAIVQSLFDEADFPYTVHDDIMLKIWQKFIMNVGVNQVVTVKEGTFASIQTGGPHQSLMIDAMKEVIEIGVKEGIDLKDDDMKDVIAIIDKVDPNGMPSMRQDALAKRQTEVGLFAETILALGAKHGIQTPVNQYLNDKIHEIERSYA